LFSLIEEIKTIIQQSVPKIHTSFVVDTLNYIYKGGDCSSIELIAGSLLLDFRDHLDNLGPIVYLLPTQTQTRMLYSSPMN